MDVDNGRISFWWQRLGAPPARPPLPGPTTTDVCVVGGGFTGLWTAYHLKRAAPGLSVTVLERRFVGYGASGRNGGWCVNSLTGDADRYARSHGRDAVLAFRSALTGAVDEVVAFASAEGVAADVRVGGELTVARTPAQLERMRAFHEAESRWPGADVELLDAAATRERVAVEGALGATWQPHCATLDPAKLVLGLADAAERAGVVIHEDTEVTGIFPGLVSTDRGLVRAGTVLRATEGFTASLPGERRTWLPMNSSMVVTEPLPGEVWERIGWQGHEALSDFAHAYVYAQRTADGRIALGGRGVPYRFGSRTDTDGGVAPRTVAELTALLHRFFPAARDARIEHAWSGVLGVPRDWTATVGLDRATGLGWAGGYVGTGVATANLAGRTLADLVLERDSELVALPWVDRRVRRWEPEPLRWLGVRGLYAAYRYADRQEAAGRPTTSPVARLADRVAGR